MKKSIILLLLACLSACSPQARLSRLISRHPELTTIDTLIIRDTLAIPSVQADTQLKIEQIHDTVYLEKGRLAVWIMKHHDTLYLKGKCKSDTVIKTRVIPVVRIRYMKSGHEMTLIGKIPWLVTGFIFLCILVIVLVLKFVR